ncbi:MAG: hypothetical protein MR582_01495, partial [Campylobacter sp.]|nr:hypothetical protein [Campylobacter sp.]
FWLRFLELKYLGSALRCFLLLEPCTAQRLTSELSYRFLATEFVVFMTAAASLKSGTKLAPTLSLRRSCAAALKTKITHPAGAKQKILEPNGGVVI